MRSAKAYTTKRNTDITNSPNPQNVSPKEAEAAFTRSRLFKHPKRPFALHVSSASALGGFTCYTITVSFRDEYGIVREMHKDVKFIRLSDTYVRVHGE
jgi:hypothetical protein